MHFSRSSFAAAPTISWLKAGHVLALSAVPATSKMPPRRDEVPLGFEQHFRALLAHAPYELDGLELGVVRRRPDDLSAL